MSGHLLMFMGQRLHLAGLAALLLLMTGCANVQLGAPVASVDNIQKVKGAVAQPVAVGGFALAAGKPAEMDARLGIRAVTLVSPYQNSFAQYLKETLVTELKAAGLLDTASTLVIEGTLVESQVDAAMSQGSGSLAAKFVVLRAGAKVYEREHRASATWESSFVGAVAIPAAINEYSALYRQLVARLLDDPAFKAALAR
ncbi:hypothetical protein [Aquabacterium sp.]|uniref:hypothetical protein n=1 Tax=Aquabacterium sp. TaxID=1872578 RepID=UPI002C397995|nr:hypothetical protein [Aquabacterium sp.]HSW05047.1 hypothetical protein [Aquabacterium sp.]